MTMNNHEHWEATKRLSNPKARWWNGHFITALQLQELSEKGATT